MSYDGSQFARRALPAKLSVLVRGCCRGAAAQMRAFTFWLAVGLPWLLLGMAFGGYVTSNPGIFTGLSSVTVLCAVAGRNYRR